MNRTELIAELREAATQLGVLADVEGTPVSLALNGVNRCLEAAQSGPITDSQTYVVEFKLKEKDDDGDQTA